jgi:hypothetical protein
MDENIYLPAVGVSFRFLRWAKDGTMKSRKAVGRSKARRKLNEPRREDAAVAAKEHTSSPSHAAVAANASESHLSRN